MGKAKDLKGMIFERLTVIERKGTSKNRKALWLCECECGNKIIVNSTLLISGKTRSCGCLRKESTSNRAKKHGMRNTRLYKTWNRMKDRCFNCNDTSYKNYGGRGITVCDEWKNDFNAFFEWAMSNGYADNLTIERIDFNGNYEPSNCRWATPKEQASNRRTTHFITYNGKTQTMKQWAEELGINYTTLSARINMYNWDIEKAFNKK